MTRLALAAAASVIFVATYSLSPLLAVAIAAIGAALLTASIAMSIRHSENQEIEHIMTIIDACVVAEQHSHEPVQLVS
jgi:hypothetical protein